MSSRASPNAKARSGPRISMSSPASRNRCSPSRGSSRVDSTTRSSDGIRLRKRSSNRSACIEHSSFRSSITSNAGSSSDRSSIASRSTTRSPRKRGVGLTRSTHPSPLALASSSITDSQKRCSSRSPRSTETHAARSARPSASSHERSSTVLPLPAGPHTSAAPPAPTADSRWNKRWRKTSPRPAADPACGLIACSLNRVTSAATGASV